jgi:hypothetical protein
VSIGRKKCARKMNETNISILRDNAQRKEQSANGNFVQSKTHTLSLLALRKRCQLEFWFSMELHYDFPFLFAAEDTLKPQGLLHAHTIILSAPLPTVG